MAVLALAGDNWQKQDLVALFERTPYWAEYSASSFSAGLEIVQYKDVEVVVVDGRRINPRAFLEAALSRRPLLAAIVLNCPDVFQIGLKLKSIAGVKVWLSHDASVESFVRALHAVGSV